MWESNDLVNWGEERLVVVEDETAGMVWAPEAIWDPAEGMEFSVQDAKSETNCNRPVPGTLGI